MKLKDFKAALKEDDFSVGDSFWIDDWEFEVINYCVNKNLLANEEVVFQWEVTSQEFIQILKESHPEIKNPEEFFTLHKEDIVHYFTKGFDVLVSECGATYQTIMEDAIDEVLR